MKLTAKEVELLSGVAACRKRRKWDAWVSFLLVIALMIAVLGYGVFPSFAESQFLGMAAGASVAYLIHVYFAVRPEDKLIGLLQRYVNRDPEAVAQLSGVVASDAFAD